MEWGVCTTVKAPLDQILGFIAWHRHLGAARIWVHLDDPDAATVHVLSGLDGVEVVACNEAYWRDVIGGGRPKTQEVRQSRNMQNIYAKAELPVIAHLDVDEFLWPARPVSEIIADWFADPAMAQQPFIRAVPAEAMNDPGLTDDIFTATRFHLPFPNGWTDAQREVVYGDYARVLPWGMLSHRAGKSLFKTGVPDLVPRLHAASVGDAPKPLPLPLHPDLTVLHFHARKPR